MITGLLRPTQGRITLCGHDVQDDYIAAKSLLSYVPDEPYLYDKLTGREFLQFVGRMYGLSDAETARKIDRLAEQFSLGEFQDELAEAYSHGMKQRVVVSAALLHEPRVIVIDEPMVGLDPQGASTLKEALRRRAAEGTCVFMSTHTIALAEEVAQRVGIIHQGRLIALGDPEEVRAKARTDGRLEDAFLTLTTERAVPAGASRRG
jgi:ABC-2 type transport system ATP-binding protein